MNPEEYDACRAAMFGQRSLGDWSDEDLEDPAPFIEWALAVGGLPDELPEYTEDELRDMCAKVFSDELAEYRRGSE
jgi:hypothetical protein